jgi:hypothetical protein
MRLGRAGWADTVERVTRWLPGGKALLCAGMIAAAGTSLASAPALAVSAPAGSAIAANRVVAAASGSAAGTARHVVVVGISELRWSDVSSAATPNLWRAAQDGAVGSLVDYAVIPHTCPVDAWLTLNAGARATEQHGEKGACPPLPTVVSEPNGARVPASARIGAMPGLVAYNQGLHYGPQWGLLASAAGPGGCATAVGPGAALALTDASGNVGSYLASPGDVTGQTLGRCALTVVDLGVLTSGTGGSAGTGRAALVRKADAELGRIMSELPPDTTLMVTAPGSVTMPPHLQATIVSGAGYRAGLLDARSTKQAGVVVLTDLTPTVLHWLGRTAPSGLTGSRLTRADRASLAVVIRGLVGRDTAEQVWTSTHNKFFVIYALADVAVFAGIGLILWGGQEERRRRRARSWRSAGVFAAAVPVGTFLADMVPWWMKSHPAVWLYGLGLGWAAGIGLVALLLGPWRRDPLGPLGDVCLLTVAVLGIDVVTGSRLQLETPFGLTLLEAGRFYGLGGEAIGIYAIAGLAGAAWLGMTLLRQHGRRAAVLAVSAVALFAVVASGWPGTGAKGGGTIMMVPCFLLLLMAVAGARITWRRAVAIALSGLVLLAVFSLLSYFVPGAGSDLGVFAGNLLHGQAGGTLDRKISSNIGSLTVSAYSPLIPVVVLVTGLMLWRPSWFMMRTVPRAYVAEPLLRPTMGVIWLAALLGWFANDSGIIVTASALPLALPLGIAMLASVSYQDRGARYLDTAVAGTSVVGKAS